MDVEVNPADIAGVRIRYRLGTAQFSIALSALYQLLLLNPQRGCAILFPSREWERSRGPTDTWAANAPCLGTLGELGWEGCADVEILLSSCGLSPPHPWQPPQHLPSKAPTRQETQTPRLAPPQTHATQKAPPSEARVLRIGQRLIVGRGTAPWTWQGGEGEAAATAKAARGTGPLWRGMIHLTPLLVNMCMCPTLMVSLRGL